MQETRGIGSRCLRNEVEIANSPKKTHIKNWVGCRERSFNPVKRETNIRAKGDNEKTTRDRRGQADLDALAKPQIEDPSHEGPRRGVEHALGPG